MPTDGKTPPSPDDWRAIAQRAAEETAPNRLVELTNLLCDILDRQQATRRTCRNPYLSYRDSPWLGDFLSSVVAASDAPFGSLQLFDSDTATLRLIATHQFGTEFKDYFETVRSQSCSCGTVMATQRRIICPDITADPIFGDEDKAALLRADVLSCQSTPLIGPVGNLVGVVSTHYDHPRTPTLSQLQTIDSLTHSFREKLKK